MTGTPANMPRLLTSISGYLDGELETTACEAIEQHCQQCPSCEAFVSGLRETIGLCRQVGSVPLPDTVRQRARESIRQLLDRHKNES